MKRVKLITSLLPVQVQLSAVQNLKSFLLPADLIEYACATDAPFLAREPRSGRGFLLSAPGQDFERDYTRHAMSAFRRQSIPRYSLRRAAGW